MIAIIKDHELRDKETGNRIQSFYGSSVTGVDFNELAKAPEGTEYSIKNVWSKWNVFDPDRNGYFTMLKSKFIQAEKIFEPKLIHDLQDSIEAGVIDNVRVDSNDNECRIPDNSSSGSVSEQPEISNNVPTITGSEHESIGEVTATD